MIKRICSLFILALFIGVTSFTSVYADELEEIEKKLSDLKTALEQSQAATTPLESNLKRLEANINELLRKITVVENQVKVKEKEVKDGEEGLIIQQEILEKRVRSFYKSSTADIGAGFYLISTTGDLGELLRLSVYRKSVINEDKEVITNIVLYVRALEEKKKELESEKARLAIIREDVNKQAEFLKGEIAGAKSYQEDIGQEIATLTVRQNELLAAKTGLFSTSVGEVPIADDPGSRPDYNPGFSPAFAAFSFGAPHFKGMSQYGAFGRAKSGQNAETILKAYYGDGIEIKKDYPTGTQIAVDGHGSYSLEEYVKRIYEVPNSWGDENNGMEALKAQAIAARSYGLARMQSSGSICPTESCQVFKPETKGGNWEQAVNETAGWVLQAGGQPFNSLYASTSGGYQESYSFNGHSTPGFWDTKNGRQGWTSEAYEKIGGSPWFYKGWYKTRSGTSCGRSHPWLTSAEFADIVNAAIVYSSGGDTSGIFPEDVQSCFGGSDQPWSKERMKEEADKQGGGVTSVSSISVQYQENGVTGKVIVNGKEIDGQKFYKAFNLRAPGAIHLKSALFNIEKK